MAKNSDKELLSNLHEKVGTHALFVPFPTKKESFPFFWAECKDSFKFILTEKENLFFAFLQLFFITAAPCVCIQIARWISRQAWDVILNHLILTTLLFSVLLLTCIGIMAYAIGFFTACLSASYILHEERQKSTVLKCLKMVGEKSRSLWRTSWEDFWITVWMISDRLSSRHRSRICIRDENASYQCWKVATMALIPALIYGRTMEEACQDALFMEEAKQHALSLEDTDMDSLDEIDEDDIDSLDEIDEDDIDSEEEPEADDVDSSDDIDSPDETEPDTTFVSDNPLFQLCKVRVVYSLLCWVVTIGGILGFGFVLMYIMYRISVGVHQAGTFVPGADIRMIALYDLFSLVLIPVIIVLVLRPLYIVAATRIYVRYAIEKQIPRPIRPR